MFVDMYSQVKTKKKKKFVGNYDKWPTDKVFSNIYKFNPVLNENLIT